MMKNRYENLVKTCCDENYLHRPRSDEVLESLLTLRSLSFKQSRGIIRQRSFVERAAEWLGNGEESFETRSRRRYTIVANQKPKTGTFSGELPGTLEREVSGLSETPGRESRGRSGLGRKLSNWLVRRLSSGLREPPKNETEMQQRKESSDSLGISPRNSRRLGHHEVKVRSVEDIHGLFDDSSTGSSPPASPTTRPASPTTREFSSIGSSTNADDDDHISSKIEEGSSF